jgi:hypothetical protein
VDTINHFDASLPHPSVLLTDESPWATGADIKYFELAARDSELPVVQENEFPASETFYDLLSEMQEGTLGSIEHEYPHMEEVSFPDGTSAKIVIKRPISDRQRAAKDEQIPAVAGLAWRSHLVVWSGTYAGYSALVDRSPISVTELNELAAHGVYVSDELETHLTFSGSPSRPCVIRLRDCRADSPTRRGETEIRFAPSPLRFLSIPAGVTYSFPSGGEDVFVINRSRKCAGNPVSIDVKSGGTTVLSANEPAPTLQINECEPPLEVYKEWARATAKLAVGRESREYL